MNFRHILTVFLTALIVQAWLASPSLASAPPVTQATLSGTTGQNDWYTSAVNVKLSATDDLEGVESTTYWLNSDPPTVTTFSLGENSILNSSFEQCSWRFFGLCIGIKKWGKFAQGWGVLMWRSSESYHQSFSAAIGNFWGGEAFWHNRGSAIVVSPNTAYNFSVWVKTYVFDPNTQVNAQVWSKKASFSTDELLAQTDLITQTINWTNFSLFFTTPADASLIYLRLRAQATSPLTIALFDQASLATVQEAKVEFNVVENGQHTLHFFSKDRAGNTEPEKTQDFQLDTLAPQDWQNFAFEPGSSGHEFAGNIEVKDVTSGISVASAKYRFYSDHQGWGWSNWLPVEAVTVAGTDTPASDSETEPVKLTTPQTDFGDSATIYQFQFQLADKAGNLSNSPVQTIEGPWIQGLNGQTAASEQINFKTGPPSGQFNANNLLAAGQTITNYTTSTGFKAENYSNSKLYSAVSLADIFPNYASLKGAAAPLPQNKLPSTSGVYQYTGDFVIDGKTLSPSFQNNVLAAIIFINGNLRIKKSFQLNQASGVVFLVDKEVQVEGEVGEMGGIFISQGDFSSDIDAKSNKQLKVKGAVLSLGQLILSRDLGKGAQGNQANPAEQFILTPSVFTNLELATLIEGKEQKVTWLEIKNK